MINHSVNNALCAFILLIIILYYGIINQFNGTIELLLNYYFIILFPFYYH